MQVEQQDEQEEEEVNNHDQFLRVQRNRLFIEHCKGYNQQISKLNDCPLFSPKEVNALLISLIGANAEESAVLYEMNGTVKNINLGSLTLCRLHKIFHH